MKTTLRLPAITIKRSKWVKTGDGLGGTSMPDGTETGQLIAEIDTEKLAMMIGAKAIISKKGVTRLQGGAVVVRVVSRHREPA